MRLNDDINYIKLEEKAERCMRLSAAVVMVIMAASVTAVCLIFWNASLMRNLVLAGCWVLAAVYIIASPALRYARYRYCIDEEADKSDRGIHMGTGADSSHRKTS